MQLLKQLGVALADSSVGRGLMLQGHPAIVPVFMLHRFATPDGAVSGHNPEYVAEVLRYLRQSGFTVMSIDEIVEGLLGTGLPKGAVAFTIDDGYWDNGQVGAEIFLSQGCPVTIYLTTRLVDGGFWPCDAKVKYLFAKARQPFSVVLGGKAKTLSRADATGYEFARRQFGSELKMSPLAVAEQRLAELAESLGVELPQAPPAEYRGLTWDEVAALEERGVSFGAHSARHVTLSAESDEISWQELEESTRAVRQRLQRPSSVFCYPTGRFQDYGPREVDFVKNLGYRGALAAEPGYCFRDARPDSLYHLLRFTLPDHILDVKDIVLQLQRFRDRARYRAAI
jgi:peptidoglycan/xylan/chitin deacetylase (PgdA/CDA1 family)